MPTYLKKSNTNKMIAGVCGGLGEYFCVDPTLIRLFWALSFFFGGLGLFAYIVAAIIIPAADSVVEVKGKTLPTRRTSEKRFKVLGLSLIIIGLYVLVARYLPDFHFYSIWPMLLIALGAFYFFKSL